MAKPGKHRTPVAEAILAFLEENENASSKALSSYLGITRQALSIHMQHLIFDGQVVRTGATRNTRYCLPESIPQPKPYRGVFNTRGLEENRVYQRIATTLNLSHALGAAADTVFQYVFTEILNNAIEHSESGKVRVSTQLQPVFLTAEIKDYGIGIFASIAQKLGFPDEHDALLQLVKGKTTTMPEAHSGEGVFFSSKAADRLVIRSHRIEVEWNRQLEDVFVSNRHHVKGTLVQIAVRRDSTVWLEDLFEKFAPEEFGYAFSRSRVHVKLLGERYISRSEARRLLVNLDRFTTVELDFRNVVSMGQGFADEIFRVFRLSHPHITVVPENTSPAVRAMIRHAEAAI